MGIKRPGLLGRKLKPVIDDKGEATATLGPVGIDILVFVLGLVVCNVVVQATWIPVSAAASPAQKKYTGLDLQDVQFTDDVSFTCPARSKLHCSLLCSAFPSCLTFTYLRMRGTSKGSCRGHSTVMNVTRSWVATDCSRTYVDQSTAVGAQCGAWPTVYRAMVMGNQSLPAAAGTMITYNCCSSCYPQNDLTITCLDSGIWTVPTLVCADCTSGMLTQSGSDSGVVYGPGYPDWYANDLYCVIEVVLATSGPLTVNVQLTYNLERESTCRYDYVLVAGVDYCGNGSDNITINVASGSNSFFITFKTDSTVIKKQAFIATYRQG